MQKLDHATLGALAKLLGGKITGLARSGKQDGDQEIFGLIVDKKKVLWLFTDFEGNGPGGFSIEDYEEGDEQP